VTAPARKQRRRRSRPPRLSTGPREHGIGSFLKNLGPGLVTGAADDDPSGISTYSQAGAAFGFGLLWTALLSFPLMVAVQLMCARLGLVTRRGLASVLRKYYPPWLLWFACGLLLVGNTINIAADLSGMGAGAELLTHVDHIWFVPVFAIVILLFLMFGSYAMLLRIFKWLTLVLFAYVVAAFLAKPSWSAVAKGTFLPQITFTKEYLFTFVAIFGTTISPYLFFWQSSQEVEEEEADPDAGPLLERPEQAGRELTRIEWETWIGMAVSNLVAFFIILTTAVTLNANGQTDIQTSAQAAAALRPIAGDWAFALFSLGIIGTGLLAVPVLAGSAGYAIGEAGGWPIGLERPPAEARGFYAVIGLAIVLGVGVDLTGLDPIKALIWSAVLNGVITVPVMAATMVVATRAEQMGEFVATRSQRIGGWLTTAMMAAASLAMFIVM